MPRWPINTNGIRNHDYILDVRQALSITMGVLLRSSSDPHVIQANIPGSSGLVNGA